MIKNIVFDMGNVLLRYDPEVPLQMFCATEEERSAIRKELFEGPEWVEGDLGTITNDMKYERVKARIPLHMHAALKRCVYEWRVCIEPVRGALAFCEYARKKGCGLYVLSNASDEFYEYFPIFSPFDYFDGIVISSDVHMVKPDVRIYRHLMEKYRLSPEECLFLDDTEENVAGARQAGMQGMVFRGDYEEVKNRYVL